MWSKPNPTSAKSKLFRKNVLLKEGKGRRTEGRREERKGKKEARFSSCVCWATEAVGGLMGISRSHVD